MAELLLHMEAPMEIIHRHMPGLDDWPRERVEGYLMEVAEALMSGWSTELEELAEVGRGSRHRKDGMENRLNEILKDFKASESFDGIMKSAVLINHQWVVKLGYSAVKEMECYDEACGEFLEQLVPSVWLDTDQELGLLQLKVELLEQNERFRFTDNDRESEYQELVYESGVDDLHRANVGVWQDKLVIIDFEGG